MKRFLAIILAMAMIFTLAVSLTACKDKEKDDAVVTDNGEVNNNQSASNPLDMMEDLSSADDFAFDAWVNEGFMDYPPVGGNEEYKLPYYNLEDKKVSFLYSSMIEYSDPSIKDSIKLAYEIDYTTVLVSPGELLNRFISMVISGDVPDVFFYGLTPALINKGYVQPWDPYFDFSVGLWIELKNSMDMVKFKNYHYAIDMSTGPGEVMWYNNTLFEEMGEKTPLDYYNENNWTWDTYRELSMKMTQDLTGNGVPDIWGTFLNSTTAFVYSTGIDFVSLNEDGTAVNNMKDARVARAMQFYVDMIIKDKCAATGEGDRDMFVNGQVAMLQGGIWYRTPFKEMIKNGEVNFVPFPRDPQMDKYYIGEGFGSWQLAKGSKNPFGAAALMSGSRYNVLNSAYENRATNDDESWLRSEWSLEMNEWYNECMFNDQVRPTLICQSIFGLQDFAGDIWYRPTQGEPWATIAAELSPRVDDSIARALDLD